MYVPVFGADERSQGHKAMVSRTLVVGIGPVRRRKQECHDAVEIVACATILTTARAKKAGWLGSLGARKGGIRHLAGTGGIPRDWMASPKTSHSSKKRQRGVRFRWSHYAICMLTGVCLGRNTARRSVSVGFHAFFCRRAKRSRREGHLWADKSEHEIPAAGASH